MHEHIMIEHMASRSVEGLQSMRAQLVQERKATEEARAALEEARAALETSETALKASEEREVGLIAEAAQMRERASASQELLKEAGLAAQKRAIEAKARYDALSADADRHRDQAKKYRRREKTLKKRVDSLERAQEAAGRRAKDDIAMAELKAIQDFRSSALFESAMVEAGIESFKQGIDLGIERVRRRYPELDFSNLESEDEDEEDEEDDGVEEGDAAEDDGPEAEAADVVEEGVVVEEKKDDGTPTDAGLAETEVAAGAASKNTQTDVNIDVVDLD